jgi:hypothetical protein
MFNAFLPKLLEKRLEGMNPMPSRARSVANKLSLEDSLWDVMMYSVGGCPGAIVSDFMRDDLTEWT